MSTGYVLAFASLWLSLFYYRFSTMHFRTFWYGFEQRHKMSLGNQLEPKRWGLPSYRWKRASLKRLVHNRSSTCHQIQSWESSSNGQDRGKNIETQASINCTSLKSRPWRHYKYQEVQMQGSSVHLMDALNTASIRTHGIQIQHNYSVHNHPPCYAHTR